MDATTAMFIWMMYERLISDAPGNGGRYDEDNSYHGSCCRVIFGEVRIEIYDCETMYVSQLCVTVRGERVLTIVAGEDAEIFGKADFVLEKRPPMCWMELPEPEPDPVWEAFLDRWMEDVSAEEATL